MSSPRSLGILERVAIGLGHIYRHQARQFPRRWGILKDVLRKELAPPKVNELGAVKKDFYKVVGILKRHEYENFTLREAMVYLGVGMEIIFFFFIGEMIGRRNMWGYIVPYDYISKSTRKKMKALEQDKGIMNQK